MQDYSEAIIRLQALADQANGIADSLEKQGALVVSLKSKLEQQQLAYEQLNAQLLAHE